MTRARPVEVVTDRAPTCPLVLEELLPGVWVPKTHLQTWTCGVASVAGVRDDRQSWRCDCST